MASHLGSAVKRLHKELKEIKELNNSEEPLPFTVYPHPESFLTWHFTLNGPTPGPFSSGRYHGKLEFPADYPFSPPSLFFLTPNGRFEVNVKVCLSVTGFHPEAWQPAWSTRTMLTALREHFLVEDRGSIGYLDYSAEAREELAQKSQTYSCPECGYNCKTYSTLDLPFQSSSESSMSSRQASLNSVIILLVIPIATLIVSYVVFHLVQ